ncbi:hypothetical protein DWB64_19060 [Fusibacter sp. A1]|nr:hypothetical protein DWB64_19060 [Fusibacter sp. A1]
MLPGVDDGANDMTVALQMIELAYEDGIRHILLTPHVNHPNGYGLTIDHEAVFEAFREEVSLIYKDLEIYLGAELYLTKDYVADIEKHADRCRLNGSDYVLVEFERLCSAELMLNSVYELKIRGYKPILAHIEVYDVCRKSIEVVEKLKQEGALLQITGANWLHNKDRNMHSFLKTLFEKRWIDFVASDAHGVRRRRPLLKQAYLLTERKFDETYAKRLFYTNTEAVLQNKAVDRYTSTIRKGNRLKVVMISAAVLVTLVLAASAMSLTKGTQEVAVVETQVSDSGLTEMTPTVDITEPKIEPQTEPQTVVVTEPQTPVGEVIIETDKPAEESKVVSQEDKQNLLKLEIETRYFDLLKGYQAEYTAIADAYAAKLQTVRGLMISKDEKNALVDRYLDELSFHEATSDDKVYDLLYAMQNELEAAKLDVAKVQAYRDGYHEVKTNTKSYYIDLLDVNE